MQKSIGDSVVMLSDEFPQGSCRSPRTIGGTAVMMHIYTEDVDSAFNQAVAAGAPVMDMCWGDRYGQRIPLNHFWSIATHKQNLTPEQIEKAGEGVLKKMMNTKE